MRLLEEEGWASGRPPAPAWRMLLAFERLLVERALPGRSVDPWRVGSTAPTPVLRRVDGLAGALLCSCQDTRPIYHLQTSCFPVTPYRLCEAARTRWCFAAPEVRRALLAVIPALTGPQEVRTAPAGSRRRPCFSDLPGRLGCRDEGQLRRRSQGWRPRVRDRPRRAFRSPRLRRRLSQQRPAVAELRNSTRSDGPILTI